jgi:PAS domain S-box-containing protein
MLDAKNEIIFVDIAFHRIEPTFNSPNLICSIVSASQTSFMLNDSARQFLSSSYSYPLKLDEIRSKIQGSLMDAAFTRQLAPEEGAANVSLSRRQALQNFQRGFANTESDERIVCNVATILLNNPRNGELLGVLACIEPEEFSLYLQRYDNMRITAPPATSTSAISSDWSRARLIRSITLDGDVDFVSAAWKGYTGLENAALLGPRWLECVHPKDRSKFHRIDSIDSTLARGRECEVRFQGRDGSYRWFADRIEPLHNEEGRLVRWYSISEDVHDLVIKRQQANADKSLLEKLLADLEVVFFNMDQTYMVSSASGTMKFDNLISQDTYDAQSLIGLNLLDFIDSISPGGIPNLRRSLMDVLSGSSSKEIVEYAFGPRYIRTILVPQINEDHEPHSEGWIQGLIGTSIDITAARVHDEVKAQMKAMEETNRLKSEFLANVSHELRTPIAGMTGLVELLFETKLGALQADYLESIQSSAHTLLQIVNDILDFSKAEASAIVPESIPFSFKRFVEDACKSSRVLAAKKGLTFLCPSLNLDVQLLGDAGRIRQMQVS